MHVGDFELFPSERVLSSKGRPLELGARAFDLLLVLVESAGRLVPKATLIERVWPGLVVEENNLPAQIAALRKVLGSGAIRTVQGYGYRLELPVSEGAAPVVADAVSSQPEAPEAAPRRIRPTRLSPLVGRDTELRDIQQLLAHSGLVTLVGMAGVGKTRLALEIQACEAGTVAWVALGPLRDVRHVPPAVAGSLGLSLPEGVEGFTALYQALQESRVLLILDCAEHLSDALAAPLGELIANTQGVRVLVTSQAPLGVTGEIVYRLEVLAVPDAVKLFAQRASAADRRFELAAANSKLVEEVCRRLDGIPLALELAAARVPSLGLNALLERLDDRFRLLKLANRCADSRHGALLAAFDWSYSLLSAAEQQVFNQLGAFTGSFSLETAARAIGSAAAVDLIGRLVDRSLVTLLAVEPPRYTLLETARQFAVDRLNALGELQPARGRMAAAVLELVDQAYQDYWSADETIWLRRYGPDLDNVRAALDWAMGNDPALGVALFGSAWPLLVEMDLYDEGRTRYSQVLALLSDSLPKVRVGRFWEAIAAYDATRQCDRARYAADLAAAMYSATSDVRAQYYALMQIAFSWRVDTEAARAAFDAARALEESSWPGGILTYGALTEGALLMSAGKLLEARNAYERAVRLGLTTSERQALAATVCMVELDIACGNTAAALQLGRPLALSLRHVGRRETRFELLVLIFSAMLLAGGTTEARATGAELYELGLQIDKGRLYTALDAMALLACQDGRYQLAARIATYADVTHQIHGMVRRRPAEEKVQAAVLGILNEQLGIDWRTQDARQPLNEEEACALALGMR